MQLMSRCNRFAAHVGAKTYGQIQGSWCPGSMERLQSTLTTHMQNAERLHFNLDQFRPDRFREFAKNPVFSDNNITNWELYRILTSPELLKKTISYGPGGGKASPPSLP